MASHTGGTYLEYPQTMLYNYPCPVGTAPGFSYHSVNGEPPLPKRVKTEPIEDLNAPFSRNIAGDDAATFKASKFCFESPKAIEFIKSQPYPQPSRSSYQTLVDSNSSGLNLGLKRDFPERSLALANSSCQFVSNGHVGHPQAFANGCSFPFNNLTNHTLASPVNFISGETVPLNSKLGGVEPQLVCPDLQLAPCESNPSVSLSTLAPQPLALAKSETQDYCLYSQQAEGSICVESDTSGIESDEYEEDVDGGLALSIEASDVSKNPSDRQAEDSSPPASFYQQIEINKLLQVVSNEQGADDDGGALVKAKKEEGGLSCAKDLRREAVQTALGTFEELRLNCVKELQDFVPVDMAGFRRRADLKAAALMRGKGLWLSSQKVIGNVPGVQVGDTFNFRIELCILGLHKQHRAGIDYITAKNSAFNKAVATSVVIGTTEQYGDDMDMGETVIYTGQGGMPRGAKEGDGSAQDQKLVRGNIALKNSFELHIPVRVIRGYRLKNKRSGTVYTYDGLYLVNGMKYELGFAGNYVFKFLLQRMKNQPPITTISSQQVHTKPLPCVNRSFGPTLMIEGPPDIQSRAKFPNNSKPAKERSCVDRQLMDGRNAVVNESLHPIKYNGSSRPSVFPSKPQKELTWLERSGNSNIMSPYLVQVVMPAPYSRSLNLVDLRSYSSPFPGYTSPFPGYGVPFFQGPLNKLSWTIPLSYGIPLLEKDASSTETPRNLLDYNVH